MIPQRSFWLSVDPLVEIIMSPYAYTWNDPVNYADPSGMIGEKIGDPGGPNPDKIYGPKEGKLIEEVVMVGRRSNWLSRFRTQTANWAQDNIREPLSGWFDKNTRQPATEITQPLKNSFAWTPERQAEFNKFKEVNGIAYENQILESFMGNMAKVGLLEFGVGTQRGKIFSKAEVLEK